MDKFITVLLLCFLAFSGFAQTRAESDRGSSLSDRGSSFQKMYPESVLAALRTTKTNRAELVRALDYFYASKDSLKIHSINFLVSNMPIHYSSSYYWADSAGRRVAYDELAYKTSNDAIDALDQIKLQRGKLHPVPVIYRDIDSIRSKLLIEDVELAVGHFRKQPDHRQITESDFLEYILPYRVSNEPLEDWRKFYGDRFSDLFNSRQTPDSQFAQLKIIVNDHVRNIYGIGKKTEPLPRLGALQIVLRGKGYCEDMADMAVFIARSRGIAATVDNIPAWATASGDHFLNFIRLDSTHEAHFDAAQDSLGREPAKVLRTTYSPQKEAIATWLDTSYIPKGALRVKNYKDVTREYWPTADIESSIFHLAQRKVNIVYAGVFNDGDWRPVWYGRAGNHTALFKEMSKGVVYLPMFYLDGRLVPAGWPYALGYKNTVVLQPDTLHKHSITLAAREKYLKFRSGKIYRLYYWNNQWKKIGEKTAPEGCTQLVFDQVPRDALLLLVPEYSQRKERPFMISGSGDRVWW